MKQKIIELIKQTAIYNIYKKKFYQTDIKDYNNEFLDQKECNNYIKNLLEGNEPFMISRLGSTELKVLKSFEKSEDYTENLKNIIKDLSGVFPNDSKTLNEFAKLYFEDITNIDLLGIWYNPFEDTVSNRYCPNAKITNLRNLEPYFSSNPWSASLENKKVLVIHPFTQSIEKQYLKRELLFTDKKVLPKFELMTYPAIQSLGGNDDYKSWFDALEKMKSDIAKIDFEIAIIGAGAYGLPLASYIKTIGKKAIHLGGSTQMLFGVYGQRWAIHPDFKDIINENWIKPTPNEKPKNAGKVENACYW